MATASQKGKWLAAFFMAVCALLVFPKNLSCPSLRLSCSLSAPRAVSCFHFLSPPRGLTAAQVPIGQALGYTYGGYMCSQMDPERIGFAGW
eukprot:754381-Hanusia_phi.AAC.3